MTEFGFEQGDETWKTDVYATCTTESLPKQKVGWFVWVLAGSYYIREGRQGDDESWRLLDAEWNGWRNQEFVEDGLKKMVEASFEGVNGGGEGGDGEGGSGGGGN